MANVSANYEGMNSAASKIASAANDLESLITKLSGVASNLSADYQGQGYDAFLNAWNEAEPKLKALKEQVDRYSPALAKAASALRDADQQGAQGFK